MNAVRTEPRLAAWWAAWKYVAILGLLLCLSLWGNLRQYGTVRSAKADCRTQMERAARIAIETERERAAKADESAGKIVDDTKRETAKDTRGAQESTNERAKDIDAVPVTGACRMPDGLPRLDKAVDEANAAAGD